MLTDSLIAAYRFHRASNARFSAMYSLMKARDDMEANRPRYTPAPVIYPAVSWQSDKPGLAHVERPEHAGLRFVGKVEADTPRGNVWARGDSCGWYTDPDGDVFKDGTGLCWGVVYQLPGRAGQSRFVAGYQLGGVESGPTIDFGTVYTEDSAGGWAALDMDAARDAARAADSMAQRAAEDERDYQAAWQAGNAYSEALEEAKAARVELKALLVDRRAAKALASAPVPALCRAIDSAARGLARDMARAKAKASELVRGEGWSSYDSACRDAFCDAAGLSDEQFTACQ